VNTTLWNFGGKGQNFRLPSYKSGGNATSGGNVASYQVRSLEESGLLPGMASLILKSYLERPTSTTLASHGTKIQVGTGTA